MLNSLPCTSSPKKSKQKIQIPDLSGRAAERLERSGSTAEGGNHISCPPQVANRSFDALEINYKIDYLRTVRLWERLDAKKFALLSGIEQEVAFEFMQTNDDFGFSLQRQGKKFFPYMLRSGDIFLALSSRSHESNMPNMSLKIGSLTCQGDLDNFFLNFHHFLRMLGCKVASCTVSRVDICADIAISIKKAGLQDLSKQVCRSGKTALYFSQKEFSGTHIGTGSISCRVYDKIKEMDDKQDMVKKVFFHGKWGQSGLNYTDITRVEFQLRRDFLKEIKVNTYKDLVSRVNEIWAYCTENWLRYTTQSIDRKNKHQSNQTLVSEFWQIVQRAFDKAAPVVREKVQNYCNMEALGKQIRGCMTSIMASVGFDKNDYFGMIFTCRKFITEAMEDYLLSPEFDSRFTARQKRYCPTL